jgi:C1A family cysteine protease
VKSLNYFLIITVMLMIAVCIPPAYAATTQCPSGCTCMNAAQAKTSGYSSCGGTLDPCGYDKDKSPMYCYQNPIIRVPVKTIATLAPQVTTQPARIPVTTATTTAAGPQGTTTPGIAVTAYIPAASAATGLGPVCSLEGNIFQFGHDIQSIRVRLQDAVSTPSTCSPNPPFLCTAPGYSEKSGSQPFYVNVHQEFAGSAPTHMSYQATVPCNGRYLIQPEYTPAADICPWEGSFTPAISDYVDMAGSGRSGFDFTFSPSDAVPPSIVINTSPLYPLPHDDVEILILANDSSGITRLRAKATVIDADSTTHAKDWTAVVPLSGYQNSTAGNHLFLRDFVTGTGTLSRATVSVSGCDGKGNERTTTKLIEVPLCENGILNTGEQQIDCGGSCPPCDLCSATTLPPRFSWNNWKGRNWLTSVKDQAACGSCYAHGPIGVMEAVHNIENPGSPDLDLSEQYFVSPCTRYEAGSCHGGQPWLVFNYLELGGVMEESCFPYTSGSCMNGAGLCYNTCYNASYYRCSLPKLCTPVCTGTYTRWNISSSMDATGTMDEVKRNLACHGPLAVCTSYWGHCLVLAGWNDYEASWLVKNSWGIGWEDSGYGLIPYDHPIGQDFMNEYAYYVQGVRMV